MNVEKVSPLLSLLANIGVIIGLIFLSIEISQNTQMMRSQMAQGRAETAMEQADSLYSSEYMPEIIVALRNGETVSEVQEFRFQTYLRAFNRNQDNILQQYLDGLLDESNLRSIRNAVLLEIASLELGRMSWAISKVSYSDEYIELVDEVITEYLESN